MKLGSMVAAGTNGTLQYLEEMPNLDGATRMKLRKTLDAIYKEIGAYDKERDKLIHEVCGVDATSIDPSHPRYAYVIQNLNKMLDEEVELGVKPVFSREFMRSTPMSLARERSLEALELVDEAEKAAPQQKTGPKRK